MAAPRGPMGSERSLPEGGPGRGISSSRSSGDELFSGAVIPALEFEKMGHTMKMPVRCVVCF